MHVDPSSFRVGPVFSISMVNWMCNSKSLELKSSNALFVMR